MTPDELRALREKHGLTQRQAASLAMVTERSYQYWESGHHPMPEHRKVILLGALRNFKRNDVLIKA